MERIGRADCDSRPQVGDPVVLTQHGRSAAVVLDVEEYEAMVEQIELLRDVRQAEDQLDSGQGIDLETAEAHLRARLGS
jgi:PHD/YefM family antitoxin component YafN of YafNO toxin-antitoxin module